MEVSKLGVSNDRLIEELTVGRIEELLECHNLNEFKEFVRERELDGGKLLNITEGVVKLWRPKVNARKFINFVDNLRIEPEIYLSKLKTKENDAIQIDNKIEITKDSDESVIGNIKNFSAPKSTTTNNNVEEILKKIVPAKSFLYRYQKTKVEKINSSYVPMDGTTSKKPKSKLFRLSSYEYPLFDLSKFKYFSSEPKANNFNDRGYYSIEKSKQCVDNEKRKISIQRSRTRSLTTVEELYSAPVKKVFEDHFYEDLCYSEMNCNNKSRLRSYSTPKEFGAILKSSYASKIQGIFNSLKLPAIFKVGTEKNSKDVTDLESGSEMYDSVNLASSSDSFNQIGKLEASKVAVEDYLEPLQWSNKDYCDVDCKGKAPSLVTSILKIFENNFLFRRDVPETDHSEKSLHETEKWRPNFAAESNGHETIIQKSVENQNKGHDLGRKSKMADRPLPVPVEIQPYFKNVDRNEAERLLAGCEDGAFILRPSSQACHAYTLTVCCGGSVHNVGVRRRADGQLALGFARRGEKCHPHAAALLEYHQKRHLVLRPAGQGNPLGRVILTGPPDHYKVPVHPPKPVLDGV